RRCRSASVDHRSILMSINAVDARVDPVMFTAHAVMRTGAPPVCAAASTATVDSPIVAMMSRSCRLDITHLFVPSVDAGRREDYAVSARRHGSQTLSAGEVTIHS